MSHHFDSPTAIADGRLNLCDVYVFAGEPGMTVLVITVNPDAGRSSPLAFRTETVYEFAIDRSGGTDQELGFRIRFGTPDDRGRQSLRLSVVDSDATGTEQVVLSSVTETEALVPFAGLPAGKVWAGVAADPFWANGAALFGFLEAAREGRFEPEVFAAPANVFDGRNVTAIVLQVPDQVLGAGECSVWATVTLQGHAGTRRVSRMGQPMLRPLFFNVPGQETEELNGGHPSTDRARFSAKVVADATRLALVAGAAAPAARAREVADAFLPDLIRYTVGRPVHFYPGGGNGRALTDDAFGTALSFVVGRPLGTSTAAAARPRAMFPHLAAAHSQELPALAELFGLRPAGAIPPREAS